MGIYKTNLKKFAADVENLLKEGRTRIGKKALISWILDSGASHHMTYYSSVIQNLRCIGKPIHIGIPNGYVVTVTQYGEVTITD